MNENESRQWVEEEMGWEETHQPLKINDKLVELLCENINRIAADASIAMEDDSWADQLATLPRTLWVLGWTAGLPIYCCLKPEHLFTCGFIWGMVIQKWADEKGIDLEAM